MQIGLGITLTRDPSNGAGGGGGGGAPAWLPSGAVAYADFVGGYYYAGGAETTVGAMFGIDAANGLDTFDAAAIVAGSGLPSQNFKVMGEAATTVLAGATVVMDFTSTGPDQAWSLDVFDNPDWTTDLGFGTVGNLGTGTYAVQASDNATAADPISSGGLAAAGPHKIAATVSATHVSASMDGQPPSVIASPVVGSAANEVGVFGGWQYLKSFAVYPPAADADLPALSTV